MVNKMPKVAELIGVKMGEQFQLKDGFSNIYYTLENNGLFAHVKGSYFMDEPVATPNVLIHLITGEIEIEKFGKGS